MAPSHHAAAAKRRASDHGAPVSWKAKGSPLGASPVGSEIDGMPAELHGAQKDASPVKARPLGAGPGALAQVHRILDGMERVEIAMEGGRFRAHHRVARLGQTLEGGRE